MEMISTIFPPQKPPKDRRILQKFYETTNGPSWMDSTSWLVDQDISRWFGVSAATKIDTSRTYMPSLCIQRLELMKNNLQGSICDSLGQLLDLQYLNLQGNYLTGTIPSELSNLVMLEKLWLDNNHLTGSIPLTFNKLFSLQNLHLSNNYLSGNANQSKRFVIDFLILGQIPDIFHGIPLLKSLHLDHNNFDGPIPESLTTLSTLEFLKLEKNSISGEIPKSIGNLTMLTYLCLDNNELTGEVPSTIGDLKNLQKLHLFKNTLSGPIPQSICFLENLWDLNLSDNDFSGYLPAPLTGLKSLRTFYLSGNRLEGGFEAVKKIKTLVHTDIVLDESPRSAPSSPNTPSNGQAMTDDKVRELFRRFSTSLIQIDRIYEDLSKISSSEPSTSLHLDERFHLTALDLREQSYIRSSPDLSKYYHIMRKCWSEAFLTASIIGTNSFTLQSSSVVGALNVVSYFSDGFPIIPAILTITTNALDYILTERKKGRFNVLGDMNQSSDPVDASIISEKISRAFAVTMSSTIDALNDNNEELASIKTFMKTWHGANKKKSSTEFDKDRCELLAYDHAKNSLELIMTGKLKDVSARSDKEWFISVLIEAVTGMKWARLEECDNDSLKRNEIIQSLPARGPESGQTVNIIANEEVSNLGDRLSQQGNELKAAQETLKKYMEQLEYTKKQANEAIQQSKRTSRIIDALTEHHQSETDDGRVVDAVNSRNGATIRVVNPQLEDGMMVLGQQQELIHEELEFHRQRIAELEILHHQSMQRSNCACVIQ